jgi:prepilin-type N-terminal cleavage/methylation domain-containing protein
VLNGAGHRGFTLVEIMLALAVTLIVTGAMYNLLLNTQRLTRTQSARVAVQSSVRAGALIVANELSELNAISGGSTSQNDILALGAHAITYRAMRGIGFICQSAGTGVIRLARSSFSGHRDPQAGRDEALVFVPGDSATSTDDAWVTVKIAAVAATFACPGVGGPGITLTLSASPSPVLLEEGTPVRLVEPMELRLYQSGESWWLGARSVNTGEAIQPLVGPLAPRGFELEYLDHLGGPTMDPSGIGSIRVTIRAVEAAADPTRPPLEEELTTQITLRSSPVS